MGKSGIQWTDVTDNIIVVVDESGHHHGWWCSKISPGCAHCYSETINDSDYYKGNHLPYSGQPPVLKLREDIIDSWARQRVPKKHFVMSMSDVFGEWVPQSWIFRMLDGMRAAARQIFQVLTKRADVMLREVTAWLKARGLSRVPSNIWLGVSVENQTFANERIPRLLLIPCDVLFLSIEPLLDDVDLTMVEVPADQLEPGFEGAHRGFCFNALTLHDDDHYYQPPRTLSWVIVGGESGKEARQLHVGRVRRITRTCRHYGVALFNKQLGRVVIDRNDAGFEGEEPDQWPVEISRENRIEHMEERNWQGDPVRVHLRDGRHGADVSEWPPELRVREFPAITGEAHA